MFDPIALNELIADWKRPDAPLDTTVSRDEFFISSAFISDTNREEDQPYHRTVRDPAIWN